MNKSNVIELEGREASVDPLSQLLQAGAVVDAHRLDTRTSC